MSTEPAEIPVTAEPPQDAVPTAIDGVLEQLSDGIVAIIQQHRTEPMKYVPVVKRMIASIEKLYTFSSKRRTGDRLGADETGLEGLVDEEPGLYRGGGVAVRGLNPDPQLGILRGLLEGALPLLQPYLQNNTRQQRINALRAIVDSPHVEDGVRQNAVEQLQQIGLDHQPVIGLIGGPQEEDNEVLHPDGGRGREPAPRAPRRGERDRGRDDEVDAG